MIHKRPDLFVKDREKFLRRHTGRRDLCPFGLGHIHDARDPNHHKFIQIGSGDREKPDPFHQRIFFFICFFQNAAVKIQPA